SPRAPPPSPPPPLGRSRSRSRPPLRRRRSGFSRDSGFTRALIRAGVPPPSRPRNPRFDSSRTSYSMSASSTPSSSRAFSTASATVLPVVMIHSIELPRGLSPSLLGPGLGPRRLRPAHPAVAGRRPPVPRRRRLLGPRPAALPVAVARRARGSRAALAGRRLPGLAQRPLEAAFERRRRFAVLRLGPFGLARDLGRRHRRRDGAATGPAHQRRRSALEDDRLLADLPAVADEEVQD